MQIYIKQRVFSWKQKFDIYDESGQGIFQCVGEVFTLGHKLRIYDNNGTEVVYIEQQLLHLRPTYRIFINGNYAATLIKKIRFLTHDFHYSGLDWNIDGDFLAHDYTVFNKNELVMTVKKRWLTWGDTYEIDINEKYNYLLCLASAIIIDCVCHNK